MELLENIKMLLGISDTDTSKDKIINYWINFYTIMVLDYTHKDASYEKYSHLESIIEQIVLSQLGGMGSGGSAKEGTNDGVKSIVRGDYKITYKDRAVEKHEDIKLNEIALPFQGQLNLHRGFSV